MDYMKRQQAFLDETKEKIISAKTTLIGAKLITYEFINEPSKPFFKGKILFEDNEVKDVCLFKSEEERAKKIFAETSNLHNEAILKLWFTTYCEAVESWILCYDKFDHLLGDWVTKKSSRDRMRYADEDLLQSRGCVMIRSLLEGIIYVHNHGLFHKSLNLTTSYVVLSNTIKIINIGMHSLKDLPVPDDATINKLRTDDLMGFKAALETHILLTGCGLG